MWFQTATWEAVCGGTHIVRASMYSYECVQRITGGLRRCGSEQLLGRLCVAGFTLCENLCIHMNMYRESEVGFVGVVPNGHLGGCAWRGIHVAKIRASI